MELSLRKVDENLNYLSVLHSLATCKLFENTESVDNCTPQKWSNASKTYFDHHLLSR